MAEAFAGFGGGGFEGVDAVVAGDGEQAVEVGRAAGWSISMTPGLTSWARSLS